VPTLLHDAVNKLYVDGTPRKIFHGYVPILRSYGSVKSDKFGFMLSVRERITNLPVPTLLHDAVNNLYVDGIPRKIFHGYVPNLRSYGSVKSDKFGFMLSVRERLRDCSLLPDTVLHLASRTCSKQRHPISMTVFIRYMHLTVYTDQLQKVNGRQAVKL